MTAGAPASPKLSSGAPKLLQVCAVDFTARRFLLPLMRAQRAAGFDVSLACSAGSESAAIRAEGFEIHPIDFERSTSLAAHWRAYRQLAGLLRAQRFEVVHAHTPVASLLARPAARRAGVPTVVYTAHGFYFHERMKPWKRRAHVALETWAQRYADLLWTQSEEDAATAIEEGIAPPERVLAISNGVDVAKFSPERVEPAAREKARRELGLAEGDGPVVVVIGRLVREKGYLELVDALARLRESFPRLRAIAVGPQLESDHDAADSLIRKRAQEKDLTGGPGADTLIFAGLRDDVPAVLALADVFCLPSWREGMPRSIIEAMAAGLPVVATDIRGCREEVVPGETGLLVPPGDAAQLAVALKNLLADPEKARRMGEAGRLRAKMHYDEAIVIERQMHALRVWMETQGRGWPQKVKLNQG